MAKVLQAPQAVRPGAAKLRGHGIWQYLASHAVGLMLQTASGGARERRANCETSQRIDCFTGLSEKNVATVCDSVGTAAGLRLDLQGCTN